MQRRTCYVRPPEQRLHGQVPCGVNSSLYDPQERAASVQAQCACFTAAQHHITPWPWLKSFLVPLQLFLTSPRRAKAPVTRVGARLRLSAWPGLVRTRGEQPLLSCLYVTAPGSRPPRATRRCLHELRAVFALDPWAAGAKTFGLLEGWSLPLAESRQTTLWISSKRSLPRRGSLPASGSLFFADTYRSI